MHACMHVQMSVRHPPSVQLTYVSSINICNTTRYLDRVYVCGRLTAEAELAGTHATQSRITCYGASSREIRFL